MNRFEEEAFQDTQARQLSPVDVDRDHRSQLSPVHVDRGPSLPASPAFAYNEPSKPGRKTTEDYMNERVVRHLNMMTRERVRPEPVMLAPVPVSGSIRVAKSAARSRTTLDLHVATGSFPPVFDAWRFRTPHIIQR